MLCLGLKFGRKLTMTLREPLPAGTVIVVQCIGRYSWEGTRLGIEAPRSLNIEREDAKKPEKERTPV